MSLRKFFPAVLGTLLAACCGYAIAQVKVGVIYSATGPVAVVGIPQKNSVALLPRRIGDVTIDYIQYDDASDPTQAVQVTKKLISEQNIDALIGPSGSPNAVAVLPTLAEAGIPMLAPVGTPAVVLPMDEKKRWVFKTTQNDSLIADRGIEHRVINGAIRPFHVEVFLDKVGALPIDEIDELLSVVFGLAAG